jgi:hypothetical protein
MNAACLLLRGLSLLSCSWMPVLFMVFASILHYSHSSFINFEDHFNIISPTPSSSSWYLLFACSHQNCTCVDFHPHVFTITRPSHSAFISSPLIIFLISTTHESRKDVAGGTLVLLPVTNWHRTSFPRSKVAIKHPPPGSPEVNVE